jgi:hypothetical protein
LPTGESITSSLRTVSLDFIFGKPTSNLKPVKLTAWESPQ